MDFLGYRRNDGKVGVRNHILVMPTCACSSDVARLIASGMNGAVSFNNQNGCGQVVKDQLITLNIMAGFAANPNVNGVLLVGNGCEQTNCAVLKKAIAERTDKEVHSVILQETGSFEQTVAAGKAITAEMIGRAACLTRTPCDISNLILGTNCGGSDPTSGLSANVAIGYVADRLSDMGATTVISETTEMIGAEKVLARKAATPETGQKILEIVKNFEDRFLAVGENVRLGNPAPGNIAGGITTLEEKSLGCIHKAGTRPITAVFESCRQIDKKGTVIMDTVAYDVCSVAEMTAGGAQLTLFSTGLGTPSGNPVAPVVKITGNRDTYRRMKDFIDFDTSGNLDGRESIQDIGERLLKFILEVASGKQVYAEKRGIMEIAMPHTYSYC